MSYSGYDIEDAVILNKASLDRGFGRAMYIRRYQTEIRKHGNGDVDGLFAPKERREPGKKSMSIEKRFHAVDDHGTARIGEKLENGDVFINKGVIV